MGKPYKMRRMFNAALNGVRIAHRATSEGIRSEDDITCVCAALIRILTPIMATLLIVAVATTI